MAGFQAVFYRDVSGREPVHEFIDALDEDPQAAIEHQIVRLNLLSDAIPHLPFPHSSQVEGELRELRCHYGRNLYRILYRRSERLIVLLHIFPKRSAKIEPARHPHRAGAVGGLQGAHGCAAACPAAGRRARRAVAEPVISQFC